MTNQKQSHISAWLRKAIKAFPPLYRLALGARYWLFEVPTWGKSIYLRYAPPGHYYSAIPRLEDLQRDQERIFSTAYRELPGITLDPAAMLALLERFKPLSADFPYGEKPDPELRFNPQNEYYSLGDAVVLYSMMRLFKPQRIIEVGSGLSTCVLLDIDQIFFDQALSLTSIDPFPDRMLQMLRLQDKDHLRVIPGRLQDVDVDLFTSLESNDILFIDSTHVSRCDSDVNHIIFDILPRLKPGVLIHFHDIFYPFEYPRRWLLDVGVALNESYLLRAFLQYNREFELLFFCDYLIRFYPEQVEQAMPVLLQAPGCNLWLRKNGV